MLLKKDCAPYKDVSPSARTLNDYKQLMAMQAEADATNAFFAMPSSVWCTLPTARFLVVRLMENGPA